MSDETDLREYLRDVQAALQAGNATEHTYRPYLKHVLEQLATGVTATNEPKRSSVPGARTELLRQADRPSEGRGEHR